MHDVVVVGGGPGGSSVAIYLARRGYEVLLVDRCEFPRRKCCGEGLFGRGVAVLDDLGVLSRVSAASQPHDGIRFTLDGCSAYARAPSGRYAPIGVQRRLLDEVLIDCAQREGVEVRTGTTAGRLRHEGDHFAIEVNGTTLRPGAIVAADGLRSGLRQRAGLDAAVRGRRYGVSAHLHIDGPLPPEVEIFYERGYEVYITPVAPQVVNVALLMNRERSAALGGGLSEGYLALLAESAFPYDRFELLDEPLATGPFPAGAKSLYRDNLVLAGDAAGFFDGITGDGMTQSLVSASECASAVSALLETGSTASLRRYERRRRGLARTSILLARLNLSLASRPALGKLSLRNLARHPDTFARMSAINSGDLGFASLRPRDILALALGI